MRAGSRLSLYGVGLVAAFGAAFGLGGVVVPDGVVESWTQRSGAEEHGEHGGGAEQMSAHEEERHEAAGMDGHEHAADGGAPPEGIVAVADPAYPLGSTVRLSADHMPGMEGAEATVSGAFATTAYSVSYAPTTGGDPVSDHKWVVHEELRDPGEAPLPDGAEAVLEADHMDGMEGAEATIDSSTRETVYMVDVETEEMTMTHHKWVVESEIHPAG